MADICVLFLSDDRRIVERLVSHLRERWIVWWAGDINHGDWEEAVRTEVPRSKVVVSVLSSTAQGGRVAILRDEMRLANQHNRPIVPFIIGAAQLPLGFGGLNYIEAAGWSGEQNTPEFQQLVTRISASLGASPNSLVRPQHAARMGGKLLASPSFVFSISSFETRLGPEDGLTFLRALEPKAVLVSAYDAWHCGAVRPRTSFSREFRRLRESDTVVVLDSGNYEASRKQDYYTPKRNPSGWRRQNYREVVTRCLPDLAFHFDSVDPKGSTKQVVKDIIQSFKSDQRALRDATVLCPIVHIPVHERMGPGITAARIVREVASALEPPLIAIPERELGDGLRQRVRTVHTIREELNKLGRYYPLHLLGTGNPLSMAAFAVAGADLFDGLEWCRTVADYPSGFLFHFQQFDIVAESGFGRVRDERIRALARNANAPYTTRALAYNLDFFEDWARTMRDLIHSGQHETLLKMIPGIGHTIYEELTRSAVS